MKFVRILCLVVFLLLPRLAAAESFDIWLGGVRAEAERKGISERTIDEALGGIAPIARIIELDRKQPEGQMSFAQYTKRIVTPARVAKGRAMLQSHRALLNRISRKYGVPPQVIVALWGIETSYGENTGNFNVVEALATLAYDGRRPDFFRGELMDALEIIDSGHISARDMTGSWAGAMGQNQFMPSSFHAFAVDEDGDGRRNIWASLPDIFGSTAHYLQKSGWHAGEKWGRAVHVPKNIPRKITGFKIRKTLPEWRKLGVRFVDGTAFPANSTMKASLVMPDGVTGPAFLVYDNARVIMKWNKSTYFVASVGLLADKIALSR